MVRWIAGSGLFGVPYGGNRWWDIFMVNMKITIASYSPSYFGITLTDSQLVHLRRIAADRAEPIEFVIRQALQTGFSRLKHYSFSEVG